MVQSITAADFARLFAVRARNISWLIGAGCSAAAGIPTAQTMTMDFKLRLFCGITQLPRLEIDPGDPLWEERINGFFDGREGFPVAGDPTEYAVAFEKAFPNPRDRRTYIEDAVRKGVPSFGHRVLAALISSGQVPCVFTPNFDPLIERATVVADELQAVEKQAHLTVAALDSADRAERCLREQSWPLLAKLHGDYQSEQLMNVPDELRTQDARMRRVLIECCRRFGLLVTGYSGRDASVMEALAEVVAAGSFTAGLFWTLRPGSTLPSRAVALLDAAEKAGVEARIIEVANFDELAGEIERQVQFPAALAAHVRAARAPSQVTPVALPTIEAANFPVLRCAALPVLAVPTEARRLTTKLPITTAAARTAFKEAGVRASVAAVGQQVAAFGRDAELLAALSAYGPQLAGSIELNPQADSWALGLLYESIVRALSRGRPLRVRLRSRGHFLVVAEPGAERVEELAARDREALAMLARAYGTPLVGVVPQLGIPFAEAIQIRLDYRVGRWWCVFDPHTMIDLPRTEAPNSSDQGEAHRSFGHAPDPAGDWRRERWARRYNRAWAEIIDAWAKILAPFEETRLRAFRVDEGAGVAGEFIVGKTTAWSRPAYRVAPVGDSVQQ